MGWGGVGWIPYGYVSELDTRYKVSIYVEMLTTRHPPLVFGCCFWDNEIVMWTLSICMFLAQQSYQQKYTLPVGSVKLWQVCDKTASFANAWEVKSWFARVPPFVLPLNNLLLLVGRCAAFPPPFPSAGRPRPHGAIENVCIYSCIHTYAYMYIYIYIYIRETGF